MAAAIPLLTTAATVGSAVVGGIQTIKGRRDAKKAEERSRKAAQARSAELAQQRKQQEETQRADELEQRKQLGARRRLAGLRNNSEGGSLFGGFTGVRQQTLG